MYWCRSWPCWMTSKVMLFMASFRSVWRCSRCSASVRSSVLKSFICRSKSSFQASSSAVTWEGTTTAQACWIRHVTTSAIIHREELRSTELDNNSTWYMNQMNTLLTWFPGWLSHATHTAALWRLWHRNYHPLFQEGKMKASPQISHSMVQTAWAHIPDS